MVRGDDGRSILRFNANRGAAGDALGDVEWQWNGNVVASIRPAAGADTTNKDDAHIDFYTTTSGGSNTRRMRLTDEGKLGIGETAPLGLLHAKTADSGVSALNSDADEFTIEGSGNTGMSILGGTGSTCNIFFGDSGDADIGRISYGHSNNDITFRASATDQMYLKSDTGSSNTGGLWVGTSSGGDTGLTVEKDVDGWFLNNFKNTSDTGSDTHMAYWQFTNVAHDNNTDDFLRCNDSSAERMTITCDGDLFNHDNAYGALSDERIKQNITDSGSQWDDIKALRVRKFKKKDDVRKYGGDAWEQIGLIAQEVESSGMDKLVRRNKVGACDVLSSAEFGTLYTEQDKTDGLIPDNYGVGDVKTEKDKVKSILYSIVHMKALKALQEAQTRIETLEAKVAVLEG